MSCATCCADGWPPEPPGTPGAGTQPVRPVPAGASPHPPCSVAAMQPPPSPGLPRARQEPPKTPPRCFRSGVRAHVPSGVTAQDPRCWHIRSCHWAPPGHPDLDDLGSSSLSPQIPPPYRHGAPGPRVTSTPGRGAPAGDSRPRASLPAVSHPYPTLPRGQGKTPRWHWGTRQGLPHLTPGDLRVPQLVPAGHPRPS